MIAKRQKKKKNKAYNITKEYEHAADIPSAGRGDGRAGG